MNNQFSFEFLSLLKKIQPTKARIFSHILITFTINSIVEYSFFFSTYTSFEITECKLPNDSTSEYSIDNCYGGSNDEYTDLTLPKCLNEKYGTGSNYSLDFDVPVSGGKSSRDHFSTSILAFSIIVYLSILGLFQFVQFFQTIKKKRLQNILAHSMIFIKDSKIKNEKSFGLYFLIMTGIYLALKLLWIIYRSHLYSSIDCDGIVFQFHLNLGITKSIGIIFQTIFSCLILPILYVYNAKNYLMDIDFQSLMDSLSNDSFKQLKSISILPIERYKELINNTLSSKYPNDSWFDHIQRINTFSFWKTSTDEIVQIILNHKINYPEDFEPMLYKESKLSIKIDNDHNVDHDIDHNKDDHNSLRNSGILLQSIYNSNENIDSINQKLFDN